MHISVDIKHLDRELERGRKSVLKAIEGGMRKGSYRILREVKKRTKVDRGHARAAWKVVRVSTGFIITNDAPHIGVLENGARPHAVSQEGKQALYEWVLRHFYFDGVSQAVWRTGKVSRTKHLGATAQSQSAAWRVVEAICWKIRHHGQKPLFIVRDGMPLFEGVAKEELEKAFKDLTERLNART